MLISESYREQNAALHQAAPGYGIGGAKWASLVRSLCPDNQTVLDYGCGKGALAKALSPRKISEYDPAIPGKDIAEPADIVVCTEVLEHIEPESIDEVLMHLASLTRQMLLFSVATKKARKTLPDGRNAHLIVQSVEWWKERLEKFFKIRDVEVQKNGFFGVARPIKEIGHIASISAMEDIRRNENVKRNCRRIVKRVKDGIEPHDLVANLVCYGPSLASTWPSLRNCEDVYCVGAAHDFLINKGIIPYASIDCDPRARIVDQVKPHEAVRYWLASCVDPSYIAKLRGFDIALWHLHNGQNSADFIWDLEPEAWLLIGGGSVGLRAVSLLYARGYRKFSIHGMDSSYLGNVEYAGEHVPQKDKNVIDVRCGDRWFKSNPSLIDYARQFLDDLRLWEGSSFELYGDGLLQEMCKHA